MPSPSNAPSTLQYTLAASLAAAALFYIFGPTLLPSNVASTDRKWGAVGLTNAANDCFINSILQALAGSPILRKYLTARTQTGRQADSAERDAENTADVALDGKNGPIPGNVDTVSVVTTALHDILNRLHDPLMSGKSISALQFIRSLERAFKSGLSRQQQDAQELLQIVVERIEEESILRQRQLSHGVDLPVFPLHGTLESQIECQTCNFKPAARTSDFTMLSLTVPQKSQASIDACLDDCLKQEVIEDYKCQYCAIDVAITRRQKLLETASSKASHPTIKSELDVLQHAKDSDPESLSDDHLLNTTDTPKRRIAKFNRIATYPSVLALHLSRSIFSARSSTKNDCKVAFAEELRLGSLTSRHLYRLVSVVTHRGRHNSGHYETFRRQNTDGASVGVFENSPREDSSSMPSNAARKANGSARDQRQLSPHKWWGISDHHVRDLRTKDVLALQQAVYLLVYEKVS